WRYGFFLNEGTKGLKTTLVVMHPAYRPRPLRGREAPAWPSGHAGWRSPTPPGIHTSAPLARGEQQRMTSGAPTPLFTPERQLTEMHSRPPYGRLRRWVPMAWTVILLWLRWRWLRVKRRIYGVDAMAGATHRFHVDAAEA